jgi:nicotinate-nucleotide pyrophosphorylase (carboxylating)
MTPPDLDLRLVRALVDAALAEDVGSGDATTLATIPVGGEGEGEIVVKAAGVICGLPVARETFLRVEPRLEFEADLRDGDAAAPGTVAARVRGPARGILTAERTALNFLQHLSGIATRTREWVALLEGTPTRLLDTRKTVPGMRVLAKYAVRCGGGVNHRRGLDDMILIKENHVEGAGGIGPAVARSRGAYPDLRVEVEVRDQGELAEALRAGPDRILLDNFDPEGVRRAMGAVRARKEAGERVPEIEVSGGITAATLRDFALAGPDFISAGALTHSAPALDLSLEFRRLGPAGEGA